MRSRSYSAIVHSSLLLFSISCLSQSPKEDGAALPDRFVVLVEEDLQKNDEKHVEVQSFETGSSEAEAVNDGEEEEGEGEGVEGTGGEDPVSEKAGGGVSSKKRCPFGSMVFEGKCHDKQKVKEIVEEREKNALVKVKKAKPEETADAARELLEQQIVQIDKAEDDLDEIIEQLREEKNLRDAQAVLPEDSEETRNPKEEM